MLKWNQVQAVADKLAGRERWVLRDGDLEEPWRTLFRRVERVDDPGMRERALWIASADLPGRWGLEDRNELVEEVLGALPPASGRGRHRSLEKMAEELEPVGWLWPGWIPRGMLSLLGSAPGAGKSLLGLDLARRVIHGEGYPGLGPMGIGQGAGLRQETVAHQACGRFAGGNVVYVDAEAVPQIQNERALAWGMDRSRLYLMLPAETYGMIDFGEEAEQDRLIEKVYDLQPELVVVDSLGSISMRGENNVEDVRAVLGFLGAVAREFEVGMLLIHHLRKRGSFASLRTSEAVGPDDFRGSTHIIAMARSVLALSIIQEGAEPDRNGPRRLEVVKTNLCRYPPALGVRFEGGPSTGSGCSTGPSTCSGGASGPSTASGWDATPWVVYGEVPRGYREPTQTEACAGWLVDTLREAGAPMRPKEVYALAKEAGFKKGVVYLARKELEGVVVNTGNKMSPSNLWVLVDGTASEESDA